APAIGGTALDSGGPVATAAWAEYDVTPAVTGNGTFSFALTSSSADSAYFSSREGAQPPELVLVAGAPPADTTPPSVVGRTPAPSSSDVALASTVTATFDEPVLGVSPTTFVLRQGAATVAASVSYDAATRTATI